LSRKWIAVGCGVIACAALAFSWTQSGEVVTLLTTGEAGETFKTDLWIVEIDSTLYLRASSEGASWFERIQKQHEVKLDRGRRRTPFRAIPISEDGLRASVNRAMAEKYGMLDRLVMLFRNVEESVPILLHDPPPQKRRQPGVTP
jgi:hypothetical protein